MVSVSPRPEVRGRGRRAWIACSGRSICRARRWSRISWLFHIAPRRPSALRVQVSGRPQCSSKLCVDGGYVTSDVRYEHPGPRGRGRAIQTRNLRGGGVDIKLAVVPIGFAIRVRFAEIVGAQLWGRGVVGEMQRACRGGEASRCIKEQISILYTYCTTALDGVNDWVKSRSQLAAWPHFEP